MPSQGQTLRCTPRLFNPPCEAAALCYKMASALSIHTCICAVCVCVCVQVVEVNGLAEPSLRQCRKPFTSFPNWVSLSYLAAGQEKAAAVHSLCQLQQIGFLQFELAFPKPGPRINRAPLLLDATAAL